MALNFPANTNEPYVDISSGLKYIFNPQSGAWESAIQPPAIIASAPPTDVQIPGFLYWDKEDGNLYIWYADENSSQWVQASPDPQIRKTFVGVSPPPNPTIGDLWWDENGGRLYVYYTETYDADGNIDPNPDSQWVDASPAGLIPERAPVVIAENPPQNPLIGSLWWNIVDGNMYVWYDDGDSRQWVVCNATIRTNPPELQVQQVLGTLPIQITGTASAPRVGIQAATENSLGVIQIASKTDTEGLINVERALTPGRLKAGIKKYVPDATTADKGSIQIATQAEVNAGTDATKAVTPQTLAYATNIAGIQPGMIMIWGTSTVPSGWIECDGRSTLPYPNLISLYPTQIPDLRGEFVRGWDHSRGVDSLRGLRSFQAGQVEQHTHSVSVSGASGQSMSPGDQVVNDGTRVATTNSYGGNETRPRNIALMYIMKT